MPPQTPQSTPHVLPLAHATHAAPPWPHAPFVLPLAHVFPSQQPAHDVASHLHRPATHRSPWPHVPIVHTPSQPLLAPQAFPVQLDVQAPAPHTLG